MPPFATHKKRKKKETVWKANSSKGVFNNKPLLLLAKHQNVNSYLLMLELRRNSSNCSLFKSAVIVLHFAKADRSNSLAHVDPYNAKIFLSDPWRPMFFSIWNHHKCLSQLFLLHLNTFVMGLRPIQIFNSFSETWDSYVYSRSPHWKGKK